ncbi:hypothetical protein IV73_GL000191 [Weissella kandleri]|uniref:MPN domain-containing protein n=1 Tax=Weissella kandleri TaxID=1616 RepID=A0A0R2JE93_9LACO|nr:JAB domain-containing protein [Weissella kandleri]KRN75696.1 hypothetical protein IV73_GL000191 [Weissella kandleri]
MTRTEHLIEEYQKQLGYYPQEECWIIFLNSQMNVLGRQLIARGDLTHVTVHPRDVFRGAVAINAYCFIILHNHPSGNKTPSMADLRVARQLMVCGEIMQIHLCDFWILTAHDHYSFHEQGILKKQ